MKAYMPINVKLQVFFTSRFFLIAALFLLFFLPFGLNSQQRVFKEPRRGTLYDQLSSQTDSLFNYREYGKAIELIDSRIDKLESDLQKSEFFWKHAKFLIFQVEQIGDNDQSRKKKLLDQALKSVDLSLKYQAEKNHNAWFYKAMAYKKQIDLDFIADDKANNSIVIDSVKKSLETNPEHYTAWALLSSLARQKGNYKQAVLFDRKCVSFDQSDYYAYLKLAVSLFFRNWSKQIRLDNRLTMQMKNRVNGDVFSQGASIEALMDFNAKSEYSQFKSYKELSDREEASLILSWILSLCKKKSVNDKTLEKMAIQLKERFKNLSN